MVYLNDGNNARLRMNYYVDLCGRGRVPMNKKGFIAIDMSGNFGIVFGPVSCISRPCTHTHTHTHKTTHTRVRCGMPSISDVPIGR